MLFCVTNVSCFAQSDRFLSLACFKSPSFHIKKKKKKSEKSCYVLKISRNFSYNKKASVCNWESIGL